MWNWLMMTFLDTFLKQSRSIFFLLLELSSWKRLQQQFILISILMSTSSKNNQSQWIIIMRSYVITIYVILFKTQIYCFCFSYHIVKWLMTASSQLGAGSENWFSFGAVNVHFATTYHFLNLRENPGEPVEFLFIFQDLRCWIKLSYVWHNKSMWRWQKDLLWS